jgi:hypothetical protein
MMPSSFSINDSKITAHRERVSCIYGSLSLS